MVHCVQIHSEINETFVEQFFAVSNVKQLFLISEDPKPAIVQLR